jgi:hypothetical protein
MSFREIKKTLGIQKYALKSRAISRFIFSNLLPFEVCLISNDYWVILFICCLALFEPRLIIGVGIYMLFKTSRRVVSLEKKYRPSDLEQLVLFIHMNHLQSFTLALESNPNLLYCDYKKKSLLHWCKFYNNTKALGVVIQMTQKYPKEELLAA